MLGEIFTSSKTSKTLGLLYYRVFKYFHHIFLITEENDCLPLIFWRHILCTLGEENFIF